MGKIMESKIPACTYAHILSPTVKFKLFWDNSVSFKHNRRKT